MESRVNYAVVGLFVLLLGVALIAIVTWLTLGQPTRQLETYMVYMSESVSGLNAGASVKYRGVEVGEVSAIELDPQNPERVELTLEIEEGTPIREDTKAVLATQGLTGLAYVELTGGSRQAPPLEPAAGQPPPVIEGGPSLVQRLDDMLTRFADQIDDLTSRLKIVLSEDNAAAFGELLDSMAAVTGTVAAHRETLAQGIEDSAAAASELRRASEGLPSLVAQLGSAAGAVEQSARQFEEAGETLDRAMGSGQEDLHRLAADARTHLNEVMPELRRLANDLRRFIEEVRRNPNQLLFGRQGARRGPGE